MPDSSADPMQDVTLYTRVRWATPKFLPRLDGGSIRRLVAQRFLTGRSYLLPHNRLFAVVPLEVGFLADIANFKLVS
jgi:hypothetical protein